MKKLKRTSIFTLLFLWGLSQMKTYALEVKIGYFTLEPHSGLSNDPTFHPPMVNYFDLIAKKMSLKEYRTEEMPITRLIQNLKTNATHIGLYLAKDNERNKIMNFSSTPLYLMKPALAVSKKLEAKNLLEKKLSKIKVCVWKDGYRSEGLKKSKSRFVELVGNDITDRCLEMLKKGRVDAFYSPDHLSLLHGLKKFNMTNNFQIVHLEEEPIGLYTVFSPESKGLQVQYEKALKKQLQEKSYEDFFNDQTRPLYLR